MVAISLYRGNLHKVPEAPRMWVMPKHRLSLRQFRALLARRDRALHTLMASSSEPPPLLDAPARANESACPNQDSLHATSSENKPQKGTAEGGGSGGVDKAEEEAGAADMVIDAKDVVRQEDDAAVSEGGGSRLMGHGKEEQDVNGGGKDYLVVAGDKTEMAVQESRAPDALGDRGSRKSDLEQKLENLNKEKHHLVQMLKQILNAEEEIKRRHSMQASQIQVPGLAQFEVSTMAGTVMRQPVHRPGCDINSTGDLEGELEDASNPHMRSMYQAPATSPSAVSPLARPTYDSTQSNVMAHTNRVGYTTVAHCQTTNWPSSVSASPSRFAPSAGQGHPANLPPLSMSGVQFTASTPSPAASTGTPTFRDTRPNQSWSQR
ncbi:uncharacterized protein LOC116255778 [Nymphaea colorata]|nr:uncharacterized protein LOC116255778 [Nymphaea colorata]XP_031487637.1 uncharacterized protein LOC116255778 [Nymphaea colorata]XP_031487638.1 uncharacterized protein LOC116255778 [Nymphaea colorata]XP_031487639.1 uncharacterized protein LOC116255778 [Nymphaea colorata]